MSDRWSNTSPERIGRATRPCPGRARNSRHERMPPQIPGIDRTQVGGRRPGSRSVARTTCAGQAPITSLRWVENSLHPRSRSQT